MADKLQAPKGGCYSEENREWYDGGQFLPSTCMPKGIARQVRKCLADPRNIAEIKISGCSVRIRFAGDWLPLRASFIGDTNTQARMFADGIVAEKSKRAIADGLMPHPVEITNA